MFHLDPPGVYQIVHRSKIQLSTDEDNLRDQKIVVVSVFGPSHYHSYKGYKRAFRLILDSFGTPSLFFEPTVSDEVHKNENQGKKSDDFKRVPMSNSFSVSNDDRPGVPAADKQDSTERCTGGLDGFYYEDEAVLFLHLDGAYDPKLCLEACQELSETIQNTGFIPVWSTLKSEYCQSLLLLFSLSHILILSSTSSFFETSYIHLFRTLDAVRQQILPGIIDILSEIEDLPKPWVEHGRLCSPRVLFLFELETDCPKRIQKMASLHKSPLKEQQDVLEEEIYQILRKCRIITNISANSLFAVPASQEYVFLFDKSVRDATGSYNDNMYTYFHIIHQFCPTKKREESVSVSTSTSSSRLSVPKTRHQDFCYRDVVSDFREFLLGHTRVALDRGFDDDSKRVAEHKHFFVIPTLRQWKSAFQKMHSYMMADQCRDSKTNEALTHLQKFINIDSEYLEMQCASIFPKIYSAYQRNLPEIYSEQQHQARLSHAINVFLNISRGSSVVPWLEKLAEKCNRYWKRGRQQCETRSLLEHSCTNPLHRVRPGDHLEVIPLPEMDKSLPEMAHSTGQRLTSYCNCGRRQGSRDEPFTIKEANYEVYRRMAKDCCDRLDAYQFLIFIPAKENTKKLSLQEMLAILQSKSDMNPSEKVNGASLELEIDNASQVMETELRQENNLGDGDESETSDDDQEADNESVGDETENQTEAGVSETAIQSSKQAVNNVGQASLDEQSGGPYTKFNTLNDTIDETVTGVILVEDVGRRKYGSDDVGDNQSTVEYLPGMLHSKSPPGLLPLFSSWSLVCLGSSSLYSHSSGVTHQPGFLNGSNSLLPWDVMVKAEAGVSKPVPRFIRGKRPTVRAKRITDEFNVKVFIGTEYECKRGHRFMLENPERILLMLNSGPSPNLKEAGTKVATSDMPLYFKCPCNRDSRETRVMIAQLMRIHVVTPKAPVHVTLHPRVQPMESPCPVFSPEISEPIKLTQSSYWVLRLPYCYVGDDQVYVPPKDVSRYNGKLLKGMYNVVSMSPAETKAWEKQNMLT